ncbi:MAG TPA: aminodeoxychorismate/anthranilate synthase component II [Gemmatimonadales bacterium]|jgi:anthranilate synthase component 2|nr:aminodeoxychorismate/anthranilate synthase component II [Gemmatimonadales bacterium]
MRVAILDNYDSFTYNLFQYVAELVGDRPMVFRNDELTFEQFQETRPDAVIISPGPGNPENPKYFGICKQVITDLGPTTPILGVCLGHQGIIYAYGGRVVRAPQPMHGKTSIVYHNNQGILKGLRNGFEVMRYHSLVGEKDTLPATLEVTAKTWDEIIMAVQHREHPIYGIQFHPESIGTPMGKKILRKFLDQAA